MKTAAASFVLFLLLTVPTLAGGDLMEAARPDPGIAMIRFPQSLTVIPVAGAAPGVDPALAKRVLRKIDPARVVPVQMGREIKGAVDRETLTALGKEYGSDLLLLFRTAEGDELRGLVYFVPQRKVHPLPPVMQTGDDTEAGLRQLAASAKKIILSFKFEQRRSSY